LSGGLSPPQPTPGAATLSQHATQLPPKTNILKGSTNGTTATHSINVPPLATSTATVSQNVTKLPTARTSQLKSSSNGSTTMTQKTSTTSVVQTSLNEVPMIPRQVQPSSEVPSKTPLHHMTSVSQSQPQTSSHSKDLPKQAVSTGIISQTTTELPSTTTIKITPNVLHNRSEQSNLSQSSNGRVTNAQSHSVLQDFKLTSIPAKTSSTILKESTTHPHRENHPFVFLMNFSILLSFSLNRTYVGSTRLNENSTVPLAEHQSYWTVKSTIVTAYRQGSLKMFKEIFNQY